MKYKLDPLSPTGIAPDEPKQDYQPYFAGGPGKPSLLDSVNGKHGAVRISGGTNVTVDNSGQDIVISASGSGGGGGAVDSVNGETGTVVLTTGDIAEDADHNYVTDAEKTVLGNTSGTNTGDQDLSNYVQKTGNETIAGIKTFSSSPVVPAPTTDLQAATKKYVDDSVTAGGGYTDEQAQDAVGTILDDSSEIALAYDDATPAITASIVASSIDESKLDASVNASLDLADSAMQNVVEDTTPQLGGELDAQGNDIIDLGDVTFQTGAVGGTLRTGTSAADKFELQAYDVNGGFYQKVLEADAGNTPTLEVFGDSFAIWDNADETKKLNFQISGSATGVTTTIADASTANRTITLPDATDTLVGRATTDTLTNKTLTSPKINENVALTATATELNYVDGVTSAIQTQLDGKSATGHTHTLANVTDITASAAELNTLDGITASTAELNYVDGVTSAIQTQIDGKQASDSDLTTIAGLSPSNDDVMQRKAGAWANRTMAQLAADMKVEVGKLLFPVGAIYAATSSTNPGTLLGFGTWAAYGEGRVMVGKAGAGTFATGGATGGAETVTLTAAQSGVPAHSHNITDPGHVHTFVRSTTTGGASTRFYQGNGPTSQTSSTDANSATTGITINNNSTQDAASAHTNLQPYIVTYLWERTA